MLSRNHWFYRHVAARRRLYIAMFFGAVVWLFLSAGLVSQPIARALAGWNAGAMLYLLLSASMMLGANVDSMRARAQAQGEKRYVMVAMIFCATLATLGAIAAELSTASSLHGAVKVGHILLAALTVLTTWLVIQVIFAINYAHAYYLVSGKSPKGLVFPGDTEPDYFDFFYAACIIGTSAQTADVSFDTSPARRIALAHSVLSFFFNTILLALTINVAATLL